MMCTSQLFFCPCFIFPDSDDTFMKKPKSKENGMAKGKKESESGKAKQAKVSPSKSPIKSPNMISKGGVKSSQPTVSKKVAPTPPKQTPTSVMAFFGSSSVQRSEKKMVASISTKRKAVSRESERKCARVHLIYRKIQTYQCSFSSSPHRKLMSHSVMKPLQKNFRWMKTWRLVQDMWQMFTCMIMCL